MTEYFYRKIGSADFEASSVEKEILPLHLTNKFILQPQYYSLTSKTWKNYDANYCALVNQNSSLLPVEITELPFKPEVPIFSYDPILALTAASATKQSERSRSGSVCIEDFDLNQMTAYLDYRYKKQRYDFNKLNCFDLNKLSKSIYGLYLESDTEELTFKILEKTISADCNLSDISITFDLKKGSVTIHTYEQGLLKRNDMTGRSYNFYNSFFRDFQKTQIPQNLREVIFYSFLRLVAIFTKISYEVLYERYRKNPEKRCLFEMYRLTMLPYEPGLWTVLNNPNLKTRLKSFNYTRSDSSIFKKVCSHLEIRNTRTLRRSFAIRPNVIVVFVNLRGCGFTDINLYNRVIEDEDFCKVFQAIDESITFFTRYSIERRGEKATLNTLFKGADDMNFVDALDMFYRYFYKIPETLKHDILYDGFTRVNHDALAEISYQCQHKNKVFKYSLAQQTLCDSISGYDFILPKDSYQLCEIGCSLHNCVASYDESILKKQCTIVCAKKEGKYKICIELWGKNVIQELGDKNKMPSEEEKKILDEWHLRHNLIPN